MTEYSLKTEIASSLILFVMAIIFELPLQATESGAEISFHKALGIHSD